MVQELSSEVYRMKPLNHRSHEKKLPAAPGRGNTIAGKEYW